MTIRRIPADFAVFERPHAGFVHALLPAPSEATPHAVYELAKESISTPDATQFFARSIGARGGAVDYAGLKDKHARTVQLVSVRPPGGVPLPREVGERGWSARLLGWSPAPVTADAIEGNRFEIVVRDLTPARARTMDQRAAMLRSAEDLLFVNYFGAQRFGSARHGGGFMAPRLVRGDFEGALKLAIATPARKDAGKTRTLTRLCASKWGQWKSLVAALPRMPERKAVETLAAGGDFKAAFAALPHFTQQMAVEAYQSHIWNAAARAMARTITPAASLLVQEDEFGEMVFPPAAGVDDHWRTLVMPVVGPKTTLHAPWGEHVSAALAEDGLTPEDLRIPGLRRPFFGEADRPLFTTAVGFEMTPPEPDDLGGPKRLKRTVRFSLGRGSYATVVLRALGE